MENRPNAQTTAAAAGSMMLAARALFFKTKHFYSLGAPRRWPVALAHDIPAVFRGFTTITWMASEAKNIAVLPRGSLCRQRI